MENNDAAVYIFNLDDKWDLDGNLPWNNARLINHSCEPNCEAITEDHQIFICPGGTLKGEKLFFDYGFDLKLWRSSLFVRTENLWDILSLRNIGRI